MSAGDHQFKRRLESLLVNAVLRPGEAMPRVVVTPRLRANAVVTHGIPGVRPSIAVSRDLQSAGDSLLTGVLAHELGHTEGRLNRIAVRSFLASLLPFAVAAAASPFLAPAFASFVCIAALVPATAWTFVFRASRRVYNALEREADAMAVKRLGPAYWDMHTEFLAFAESRAA